MKKVLWFTSTVFSLVCGLLCSDLTFATTLHQKIQGQAFMDGVLIYKEIHSGIKNPEGMYEKLTTEYFLPNGDLIAKLNADFSKNKFIPELQFQDFQNSIEEKSVLDALEKQKLTLSHKSQSQSLLINQDSI